jgi:hypothetical protein
MPSQAHEAARVHDEGGEAQSAEGGSYLSYLSGINDARRAFLARASCCSSPPSSSSLPPRRRSRSCCLSPRGACAVA